MKNRKIILPLMLLIGCNIGLPACKGKPIDDPYKGYIATEFEINEIPLDYESDYLKSFDKFGYNKIVIFTDYESYSVYDFNLHYTESYFELNDLLVFVVSACSSDEMELGEILQNEGRLYPLFYRARLAEDAPITSDFIIMPYYVELAKDAAYKGGEIILRYKDTHKT